MKFDKLSLAMARANLEAMAELWLRPRRLIWLNFLAGLARGFGIAIGLTLVAAAFLSILGRLAALNLPVIGRYVAEIVRLVNAQLRSLPR
ncbi:MAG: DUF5665 domain-containing protein [Bacteroidota bacterium]